MKILFFGTYNTKTSPRIQVMIDGLRKHDDTVMECNVPLPISTAERVAILRQPWKLPILAIKIFKCWVSLILKAKKFKGCDAVIVGHLGQFDIHLAKILFRHTTIALDYMVSGSEAAHDRKLNKSWKDKLLIWLDNSALKNANIIIVDTEEHRDMLPDKFKEMGVVVYVGASQSWFDAANKPEAIKQQHKHPLRIIFFGLYTPLQGTPTIAKALNELRFNSEVTMIGKGQDKIETKQILNNKLLNVKWLDWVDINELPKVVAANDICLGVFGTGPKALKVVPNKVFQGAAVGCAIITSDTPPQRRVFGDAAMFVPVGNYKSLAIALNELAKDSSKLINLRLSAYEIAQKQFNPYKVVEPLLNKLT